MKRLLIAGLFLALGGYAHAQNTGSPFGFRSAGYCQITSLSGAVALVTASCSTGSVPPVAFAEICVSGAPIRYRDDGTNPTASIGVPVGAGVCFQYSGNIASLTMIQQSAGAKVDVLFYY